MADTMVQVRRPPTNRFAEEPQIRIGRSQFDRSHSHKTAFDVGYLTPIFVDEVLPGDTMTMRLNGFARIFSPLDAPIMDNIELETFFFFVPTRLVWDNWQYFNGEHDAAGAQDTDYTIPILTQTNAVSHSSAIHDWRALAAYMGIPSGLIPDDTDVNALPFRCYNFIYNEWFRDQNLIGEKTFLTTDGPDNPATYFPLRKSAKKHDYFTSCLPYLQKGEASTVSIDGVLPVKMYQGTTGDNPSIFADDAGHYRYLDSDAADVDVAATQDSTPHDYLYVDLQHDSIQDPSAITQAVVDINALRESVAIQRLLERDARGGTRYVELIKSHFGVTSPDFRLQRPEYLGGGKSFINVAPVANTSGVDSTVSISGADEYQGELRGVGTGIIRGHGWAKSFTEHGYILGLMRARGDVTYFQGLDRMWSRSTRYDFYIPALANLGEQSVLNKEIFVQNAAADDNVFGYQERWSEYRTKKSLVTGLFNPDAGNNIAFWHLAEDFSALPTLNETFINDATPMSRIQAVSTNTRDFLLDLWFDYRCARPMPVHSIPSLIGLRF